MNLFRPATDPLPYGPPLRIVDVSPIRSSIRRPRPAGGARGVRRRIAATLLVVAGAVLVIVGAGPASAVVPA